MIRRRAIAAGPEREVCNDSFRTTRITAYLEYSGMLKYVTAMANHASIRTTHLYNRRRDHIILNEIEQIRV